MISGFGLEVVLPEQDVLILSTKVICDFHYFILSLTNAFRRHYFIRSLTKIFKRNLTTIS